MKTTLHLLSLALFFVVVVLNTNYIPSLYNNNTVVSYTETEACPVRYKQTQHI